MGDGVLSVFTLAELKHLEFYREWYTDGKSKHPECQFMKSLYFNNGYLLQIFFSETQLM